MATGRLEIDLEAVARNWQALAALGSGADTGAVVKADAYGLGLAPVAHRLAQAGARQFFVATAEEGADLRGHLGPDIEIHVFSGHMPGDTDLIAAADLIPLLNDAAQLVRHRTALPQARYGIQLDTGMSRLGVEPAAWPALKDDALAGPVSLVMSHLACADEPDHPMNAAQCAAFAQMTAGSDIPRSLAATGGILLGPDYHFEVTRPGVGLYGGLPFAEARPVVRLSLPVIQTRLIKAGDTVGYGASFRATARMRIATLAGGYADGLLRSLSHRGQVFAGDQACAILGRVSMDMIGVDVTHLSDIPDMLDILCPAQSVDDLAAAAGTIGYEILTSLGARYNRHYLGASS